MNSEKFKNGLSITYQNSFDINNITDETINGIIDVDRGIVNLTTANIDSSFEDNVSTYRSFIKDLLLSSSKKNRTEIFSNLNTENLIDNIRFIYNAYNKNITKDEVIQIIKDNKFLLEKNINNIKSNYEHIRKQQYIYNKDLDSLYVGKNNNNIEENIARILRNKRKIPKYLELLSVVPNQENKKQLSDNLLLIVKANGIIDNKDINEYKDYFQRSLEENLVEIDKHRDNKDLEYINDTVYSSMFNCVKGIINETIKKMNPNFINDLNRLYKTEEYNNFISSFETVRKWNSYTDIVKRQEDLRDEFITRILFGTIKRMSLEAVNNKITEDSVVKNYIDKMNKNLFFEEYSNIHIDKDMLIDITGDDWKEYFSTKSFKGSVQPKFVSKIKNKILEVYPSSNKFFEEPPRKNESEDLPKKLLNKINDSLLNQLPNKERREHIINKSYDILDKINKNLKNNTETKYKDLFKIVNYYLNSLNEFDIQNLNQLIEKTTQDANNKNKKIINPELGIVDNFENVEILGREIINTDSRRYSNMDRVLYYLYNSNRLAHSAEKYGLYRELEKGFVFNPNNNIDNNKKEVLEVKYAFLDRHAIPIEFINDSIDKYMDNNYLQLTVFNIIDMYTKSNGSNNIEFKNEETKENTVNLFNVLIPKKYNNIHKEPITKDNITDIVKALNDIQSNSELSKEIQNKNKKIRDSIKTISEERNLMFNVKKTFIDIVVKNTEKTTKKKIENNKQDDKVDLYMKKGYVAELQPDGKNMTLVCYSNKFNNAFSVHDISNINDYDVDDLKENQSISHTKNHGGLIRLQDVKAKNVLENINLSAGFIGTYSSKSQLESKMQNEMTFETSIGNVKDKDTNYLINNLSRLLKKVKTNIDDAINKSTIKGNPNKKTMEVFNEQLIQNINKVYDEVSTREGVSIEDNKQLSLLEDKESIIKYKNKKIKISNNMLSSMKTDEEKYSLATDNINRYQSKDITASDMVDELIAKQVNKDTKKEIL